MDFQGLNQVIKERWQHSGVYKNAAHDISARFKSIRYGLRKWSRHLSQLNKIIDSCNFVLALLDGLEDQRHLSLLEKNFRKSLKLHLIKLLEAKRIYWRNITKIRWAKLGGENTSFSHTYATKSYRNNFISCLTAPDD